MINLKYIILICIFATSVLFYLYMKDKGKLSVSLDDGIYGVILAALTTLGVALVVDYSLPSHMHNTVAITIFVFLGFWISLTGIVLFLSSYLSGTTLKSYLEERKRRNSGPYSFVRNPISSSYLLFFSGIVLCTHTLILFSLPVLYWFFMTIIKKREEKRLIALYGDQYICYMKAVNRCIPWFPN